MTRHDGLPTPHDVITALLADVARALNRCVSAGLDIRAEYGVLLSDAAFVVQIDGRWAVRSRVIHQHSLVNMSSWKDADE
jgi:hypothetical protein